MREAQEAGNLSPEPMTVAYGVPAKRRVTALLLDGDAVRGALVPAPGYGDAEREAFYATLANLAGLLAAQEAWVAVAATLPLRRFRDQLRAGAPVPVAH